MWPALAFAARVFCATDRVRADGFVDELLSGWRAQGWLSIGTSDWVSVIGFVLPSLGRESELLEGAAQTEKPSPWLEAAVAFVSGDYSAAADVYAGMGALPEEAYARLRAAEALVREGRRAEADAELNQALAFWRSVRATAYVDEGEALLAASA